MLWGKRYGREDPQLIEGDNFRMILAVPEFSDNPAQTPSVVPGDAEVTPQVTSQVTPQVTGQVAGQVTGQVTGQVELWVIQALSACAEKPRKSTDIQQTIGIRHRETFQRNYLDSLIHNGWLERTIPEKPNSRLQKYRLTAKGRAHLGHPTQDRHS